MQSVELARNCAQRRNSMGVDRRSSDQRINVSIEEIVPEYIIDDRVRFDVSRNEIPDDRNRVDGFGDQSSLENP